MRSSLSPTDPRHGTVNGYTNLKCRCDACRSAWAEKTAGHRNNRADHGLPAEDPHHGKYTTYLNYLCRCGLCRAAYAAYMRAYRLRVAVDRA